MADLAEACLREDWATGRRIQFELLPLIRSLFSETNPIPVKTALSMMGKCDGELRSTTFRRTAWMEPDTLARLAEIGNIAGVKEAMGLDPG